ncbi:hypothetical protein Aph02nite_90310 [Actinoplanes philippinensis]|nr:hypothetical protein Aph02nite_90310 [Actinoplanes philippinensis]
MRAKISAVAMRMKWAAAYKENHVPNHRRNVAAGQAATFLGAPDATVTAIPASALEQSLKD